MRHRLAEDRPGLVKLKHDVEKNKKMVRQAAPVTVENKGMSQLETMGEELYEKAQVRKKRAKGSFFSKLF